jgi:hypothetical protein
VEEREKRSERTREGDTRHVELLPPAELRIQGGVDLGKSDFKSKSEKQLLEDTKVVGPMSTSVYRSHAGIATSVSPNDDDPLTSHKITFPDDDVREAALTIGGDRRCINSEQGDQTKEMSSVCHTLGIRCNQRSFNGGSAMDSRPEGTFDPVNRRVQGLGEIETGSQDSGSHEGDLSEKGQSSSELDNQGCDSQPSMDKSEGKLLEDTKVVGSMLTSTYRSREGIATSVSPNDDDQLVYLKAVDQIRREKALGPSRYTGDASHVNSEEHFEFERPYFGPSHVDDGGGAELNFGFQASNFWRSQSKVPQVELPTEIRKAELKRRTKASEQQLSTNSKFFGAAWRIRHSYGRQREEAMRNFWKEVYQERNYDPRRVFKEFALNDYLEASDELHGLECPMRSWWRPSWEHRSSAVTVCSGTSVVGTGSVSGTGLTGTRVASGNPLQTSDALFLRGAL